MKRTFTFLTLLLFANLISKSQCPTITSPSVVTFSCNAPVVVTAMSNYAANITSRWIGPGGLPLASAGTATSVTNIQHIGTYTVEFTDNSSSCVVTKTLSAYGQTVSPASSDYPFFDIATSSGYTQTCPNSVLNFSFVNAGTWPINGGPVTYSFAQVGSPIQTGTLSTQYAYSVNSCGNYVFVAHSGFGGCISAYTLNIGCSNLTVPTVSASPDITVCAGSSATLSATGANTYTWSTFVQTPSIVVSPTVITLYTVTGANMSGCTDSDTVAVSVNTTCAIVWPGDANSDGVVNSSDVLEIGLAFNTTGSVRSGASNNYSGQYANVWSSWGLNFNHCHTDCNGDGTINHADTVAIFNNYLLTHSFKPSAGTSAPSDITLSSPQPVLDGGQWNVVDVLLGSSSNAISQLYGIAFDVNFDQSMLENNSAYLVYTPSFLNASSQNVQFRKPDFTNGKLYAASVRTNGNNVNGNGKIAELHFKVKAGLPSNSVLNLSVSNAKKIDNSGVNSTLSSATTTLSIIDNLSGIEAAGIFENSISLFPNPASYQLTLKSDLLRSIDYSLFDIVGREIQKDTFSQSKIIDLTELSAGTYIIRFEAGTNTSYKKLVVEK